MKRCLLLLTLLAGTVLAEESPIDVPKKGDPTGVWWDQQYIENRGLIIWNGANLTGAPVENVESPDAKSAELPILARQALLYQILPVQLPGEERPPLASVANFTTILRLQSDLTSEPDTAKPATFTWQDSDGTNSWDVDAAVILESYFPGMGPFMRYNANDGMAMRLITAGEWERTEGGDDEKDIRRFEVALEFNMFPRTMAKADMPIPQSMKVGVLYEEDAIKSVESWKLNMDMGPAFTMPTMDGVLAVGGRSYYKGFFDLLNKQELEEVKKRVNDRVKAAEEANIDAIVDEELPPNYFFFDPIVALELGESESFGDIVDNFSEGNIRYGLDMGFSFSNAIIVAGRVDFIYSVVGRQPFDGGDNHVYQEASVVWKPMKAPLSVYATYQKGENAPTYEDEDLFKVGVGARF